MCPHGFNGLFDSRHVVTAYVVGDDDVAGVNRRAEALLDLFQEQGAGHGPVRHQGCGDVIMTQPGDEGGGVPMSVRNGGEAACGARP